MPETVEKQHASGDEIVAILGPLDEDKLIALVNLNATVAEVEEASMWLDGDRDVFGAEPPLKGKASEIVTLLTPEDEDER
jgi:hypothetical protein